MRFEKELLKSRYWTYENYLEVRCEALPAQIEKKFKNTSVYHEASTCFGMSNYINVEKQDENGDTLEQFTIRISDHTPTGSGESCDGYIYIDGKTWAEIKAEVFDFISEKI